MLNASDNALSKADDAFVTGDKLTAEFAMALAESIVDAVANGGTAQWAKDTFLALTGVNPQTLKAVSS